MAITQIWGHRGWRTHHPDNTAVALGAAFGVVQRVEIDVRCTRDNRLVLSHDADLGGLVVAENDWTTLRSLDLGVGQRPLLLEEALAMFPDRPFDIEVKNSPFDPGFDPEGGITRATLELARSGDLISSFHWPSIDACVETARDAGVGTGLLLDLDMPVTDVIDHALSHGHAVVLPSTNRLETWGSASAISSMHEADLQVVAWTVNDDALGIRLAGDGIDAIITDDPGRMRTMLARAHERGQEN